MASPFDLSSSEPSASSSPQLFASSLNGSVMHQKVMVHHSKHHRSSTHSHNHNHSHSHNHNNSHTSTSTSTMSSASTSTMSSASTSNHTVANIRSSQSPFPSSSSSSSSSSPSANATTSSTPGPTSNLTTEAAGTASSMQADFSASSTLTLVDAMTQIPPSSSARNSTATSTTPTANNSNNDNTTTPASSNIRTTNINADSNNNSALSSLLHSPLHQPLPPLQLTQPSGTFPKQRSSSINSITSNQSFTLGQSTVSGPGPLHHSNTTHNIPSSATSQQPRSMSIISLNSPRESLISADDLKNLPGTRNNSYNSLVSLSDLALRKQKQSSNSNKRGDTSLVSDDEDLGLHLNNTNMLLSSLKPSMGHGKLQLPASMVFTEFKRLSSGSNPLQPTSGGGGGSNPNYISPGSSHLKMHDLTPSPLSLAENPFNDYNFAQAQARHHHRQCSSLGSHKIDPIQSHQPVSDAESDISLVDHHISGAPDGDRDMTTVESPIILPSVSPTSSSISNASMSSTNSGSSSTAPLPPSHQRTPSISNENSSATNPAKKLKSIRQILSVSKSSSKKPSITSSQPSTSSQALLLKKKYIFSKDIQFELLQKKTSAVNEMITTKFVRSSSLPQSKSKFSTGERESSNDDTVTRSKSFDEKSTGTQTQWKQQQKLIQQLNRKWNKNDLELSDINTSSSASATTANSRKRSRGKDDDDDDNVE